MIDKTLPPRCWCLLTLVSVSGAFASPTTEVEKYLNGLATWSADFTQTIDDGHGKVMRSAAGKLYLQKPGKFRWIIRSRRSS